MMRRAFLTLVFLLLAWPAFAVNPDELLADPALEARARHLSAELRCLVCQNQSIDDSNADLAKDLRVLLRERLKTGDTDDEVLAYLVSRYGEFVLLKPRLSRETILLWSAPWVFLLIGAIILVLSVRSRRKNTAIEVLTDDEKARVERLMGD